MAATGGSRTRDDRAVTTTDTLTTFADLGLRDELLEALTSFGYEAPTPIQRGLLAPG